MHLARLNTDLTKSSNPYKQAVRKAIRLIPFSTPSTGKFETSCHWSQNTARSLSYTNSLNHNTGRGLGLYRLPVLGYAETSLDGLVDESDDEGLYRFCLGST